MQNTQSRARGVLFGQAVGDALGTTVEFQSPESIASRDNTDNWPNEIVGKGPFKVIAGQITDDTELALSLARSVVAQRGYNLDAVASAYIGWRRSEPWDCGSATHQAFGARDLPGNNLAAFVSNRANATTQANGSLMRISPLGIFGHHMNRLELARLAASDSQLSHPHPLCQAAVAVYATTIADAVANGISGPELCERALTFAHSDSLMFPAIEMLEAAKISPPYFDDEKQGWVKIAFEMAFYHLNKATDFKSALIAVVKSGGDTDTTGCITGALLGSVFGEEGIPVNWRNTVTNALPMRPVTYRCSDLVHLADSLVFVGTKKPPQFEMANQLTPARVS
jgi:ADP-ribosyl-[dinitrogen reductase] hydrolase